MRGTIDNISFTEVMLDDPKFLDEFGLEDRTELFRNAMDHYEMEVQSACRSIGDAVAAISGDKPNPDQRMIHSYNAIVHIRDARAYLYLTETIQENKPVPCANYRPKDERKYLDVLARCAKALYSDELEDVNLPEKALAHKAHGDTEKLLASRSDGSDHHNYVSVVRKGNLGLVVIKK